MEKGDCGSPLFSFLISLCCLSWIPVIRSQLIFHTSNPRSTAVFTLCPLHAGESHRICRKSTGTLTPQRSVALAQRKIVHVLMCTPVFVEFRRMCVTVTSDSSQLCRLLRNPLNARPRWTRSSFLYHQPPPPPPRITRFLHIVASSVYETFLNSCTFILTMWLHVCLKHLRLFASLTE